MGGEGQRGGFGLVTDQAPQLADRPPREPRADAHRVIVVACGGGGGSSASRLRTAFVNPRSRGPASPTVSATAAWAGTPATNSW